MSRKPTFESSSIGRSTPTRPTGRSSTRTSHDQAALVVVRGVVREQFGGGDGVVAVTGDLPVDDVAHVDHRAEVGGVLGVDARGDVQGPEFESGQGEAHDGPSVGVWVTTVSLCGGVC